MCVTIIKSHIHMAKLTILLLGLLLGSHAAQAENYTGFYDTYSKPQDTGVGSDRVQVLSFFSYSCKACRDFDSPLQSWLAKNTKEIMFQKIPSTFIIDGKALARIYYTAEELKAKPKLHDGLYSKVQNNQLVLDRNDLVANFLGSRLGKDSFSVEVVMDSLLVNSALLYAEDLSSRYQPAKLPAFVVNGRYSISLSQAGSVEKLFKILDYLIDKELNSYRYQSW